MKDGEYKIGQCNMVVLTGDQVNDAENLETANVNGVDHPVCYQTIIKLLTGDGDKVDTLYLVTAEPITSEQAVQMCSEQLGE